MEQRVRKAGDAIYYHEIFIIDLVFFLAYALLAVHRSINNNSINFIRLLDNERNRTKIVKKKTKNKI